MIRVVTIAYVYNHSFIQFLRHLFVKSHSFYFKSSVLLCTDFAYSRCNTKYVFFKIVMHSEVHSFTIIYAFL
jgi:hypothetical protein